MTDQPSLSTAAAMAALRRSSDLLLAGTSHDQQLAAGTLLENAAEAQAAGDVDRARTLVRRAKALGRDEHEDAEVCSMAAHMALFTLVSDVVEDEEPMVWLDAAETVLPSLDGAGRTELLGALLSIGADAELEPAERRALRRLVHGVELPVSVFEGRVLEVDDVLQVLAATAVYDDAVDSLLGEP